MWVTTSLSCCQGPCVPGSLGLMHPLLPWPIRAWQSSSGAQPGGRSLLRLEGFERLSLYEAPFFPACRSGPIQHVQHNPYSRAGAHGRGFGFHVSPHSTAICWLTVASHSLSHQRQISLPAAHSRLSVLLTRQKEGSRKQARTVQLGRRPANVVSPHLPALRPFNVTSGK